MSALIADAIQAYNWTLGRHRRMMIVAQCGARHMSPYKSEAAGRNWRAQ